MTVERKRDLMVVFHMTPNSTHDERWWPHFNRLANYLVEWWKADIYCVGALRDAEYIQEVASFSDARMHNLAGLTTLETLIDILKECDLLVCVNSFVMHLGVALDVPMFAIVGATEPKVILPPGIPHAYSPYAQDIPLQEVIDGICNRALKGPQKADRDTFGDH